MYLTHALFWAYVGLEETGGNPPEALLNSVIAVGVIAVFIALINIIAAILSVFRDQKNPTKFIMICKLVAIPWYIANFVLWACTAIGFLNPFFMIAIPILIFLSVLSTYIIMLSTGLYSIAYLIRGLKKKMFASSPQFLPAAILHFFFCLDVPASIWLYVLLKKER